jgi:hypothetical protein
MQARQNATLTPSRPSVLFGSQWLFYRLCIMLLNALRNQAQQISVGTLQRFANKRK